VQEHADQKQVPVDLGVQRQEPVGRVEQGDDVLQQAADVGVVVPHTGRDGAEVADERVVHQEALGQCSQVRLADLPQGVPHFLQQHADVLGRVRQEVGQLDRARLNLLQSGQDDLQGPLEKLDLAAGADEVADVEGAEQRLAGVPEPGVDHPGAVAEVDLDIEVAVAVGPQLLVGDEVNIFDGLAVGQLGHIPSGHERLQKTSHR
jgi:hypothetical protein